MFGVWLVVVALPCVVVAAVAVAVVVVVLAADVVAAAVAVVGVGVGCGGVAAAAVVSWLLVLRRRLALPLFFLCYQLLSVKMLIHLLVNLL